MTSPHLSLSRIPASLIAAAVALTALGVAGLAREQELDGGRFLEHQLAWTIAGLVVAVSAAVPSYRLLGHWSYAAYGLTLAMLALVYLFPPINGAHRWFRAAGLSFQPSELAKITVVLALARYLTYRESYRRFRGLLPPLAIVLVPAILILRQPDLGTALVFMPLYFVMLFAAGARKADLAKAALCGLATVPILWLQMSGEQRSRVTALFEQTSPGVAPTDDGYHLHQSKQRLALGGAWGTWVAAAPIDDHDAYYVPEDHCDFIFTVVGERFGWLGVGGLLALYALLVQRGMRIAERTHEPFGRLMAVGLTSLFGVQALVNSAMTVGLLPITGMSLPLVSYGGSGLVSHALALGLLVNIAMRPGYEVAGEPFRFASA